MNPKQLCNSKSVGSTLGDPNSLSTKLLEHQWLMEFYRYEREIKGKVT
jgi:hypothetical protein